MSFKFYHATSDIFIESIKEHGLGGINPNFKNSHLEILRCLYDLAEHYLTTESEYAKIRASTRAMSRQETLKLGYLKQPLNFKHDNIYIALSRERAISHASLTKYGSEILSTIMQIIILLDKNCIEYTFNNQLDKILNQIKTYNPKPIIIEINNLKEEEIEEEVNGILSDSKTASFELIREKQNSVSEKEWSIISQKFNFKLLNPVPSKNLKIYDLDLDGEWNTPEFNYTMTQIR